jgi:transglutaminase-like putative cysteine protease
MHLLVVAVCLLLSSDKTPAQPGVRPATLPSTVPTARAASRPASADLVQRGLLRISQRQRLRVTHRTTVSIPQTETFRLFHALPQKMPWSSASAELGLEQLSAEPSMPTIEVDEKMDGHHFRWELRSPPEGSTKFVTTYNIVTATREFMPGNVRLKWSDFSPPHLEPSDPLVSVATKEMFDLVEAVRRKPNPMLAVPDLTKWIDQKVVYDAGVGYSPLDVRATLQSGRGHCGHRFEVFKLLCTMAGISCRIAWGFQNNDQQGTWNGREDWHRHTWAEIEVPGVGWVEVEPGIVRKGKSPFYIPSTYIQNRSVQSFSVWYLSMGQWERGDADSDAIEFKVVPWP